MILCRSHGTDRAAIHKGKDRYLTSCHKLLNNHSVSGSAKFLLLHDFFYTIFGFLQILTDQYTFPQSQTVSLQHNRKLCFCTKIFQSLFRIIKILICSSRNIIFLHQILGKSLGAFQNSRIFTRSEYSQSFCLKHIYNTTHQRIIHTNDSQVNPFLLGKICQSVKFHGTDIHTLSQLCNSCISWCTVNLIYLWAFRHTPRNSMFSSAAAYDQNLHFICSLSMSVPGKAPELYLSI